MSDHPRTTLFGAPLSLYSGKARSYLDWKGVDYIEKLPVDPVFISEVLPAVGRSVIPVVRLGDGTILQDTTVIIDHFEATEPGPSIYPQTPRQRLAALLLECFGDEWLVIPAMHYRWNYNALVNLNFFREKVAHFKRQVGCCY